MSVQSPIDPPDEGTPYGATWDCPECEETTTCTEWVEITGRYQATITTICDVCEEFRVDYDDTYGYDG
jgi:hypothetical protein